MYYNGNIQCIHGIYHYDLIQGYGIYLTAMWTSHVHTNFTMISYKAMTDIWLQYGQAMSILPQCKYMDIDVHFNTKITMISLVLSRFADYPGPVYLLHVDGLKSWKPKTEFTYHLNRNPSITYLNSWKTFQIAQILIKSIAIFVVFDLHMRS